MNQIAVNTDTLNSDINSMKDALKIVEEKSKNMQASIQELSGMWEGPAHNAFLAQFNTDCASLEELDSAIKELISCMEYADKEYVSCEQSVSSLIASIRI